MREGDRDFYERQRAEHALAYGEWRARVMGKFDRGELTAAQGASVVRQLKSEELSRSVVSRSVEKIADRIAADVAAQLIAKRAEAAKRAPVAKRATATTMVERGFWRNPGEEAPAPKTRVVKREETEMGRRSIWRSTVFGGAERVQKGGGPDSTGELYSPVGGNHDVRTFTDESEVFRPVFQDETVDDRAGARASDDQQFMDSLYARMGGMGFQRVAAMPPDSRSYDDVGETAQLDDDEFLHGDKFSDSNYSGGVERAGGLSRPFAGYALPVEGETRQRMVRLGNNWIPAGETSRTPNSDFRAARGVSKPFTRRLPDAKTPPARSAVRKSLGGLFRDAIFDRDGGTSTTR